MTARPVAIAKSILKYARSLLRRPRAFFTKALFRATPKRLHFLLFRFRGGFVVPADLSAFRWGKLGLLSFASAPRIVGDGAARKKVP